jgi:hypothetical protein
MKTGLVPVACGAVLLALMLSGCEDAQTPPAPQPAPERPSEQAPPPTPTTTQSTGLLLQA